MPHQQPELTPEERESQSIWETITRAECKALIEDIHELHRLVMEHREEELKRCAETGDVPYWIQPALFHEWD